MFEPLVPESLMVDADIVLSLQKFFFNAHSKGIEVRLGRSNHNCGEASAFARAVSV
jgi:hypothetical protein